MMIALLIFTACILFLSNLLVKWQRHTKKYNMPTIPGPKPLPIIGNILEFGFDITNMMTNFSRICSNYNGICRLFLGPKTVVVVVSHPKYLKKIFKNSSEHIEKTNFYDFFKGITGKGIVSVEGPIWHNNRKALQPAFQYAMLEDFNKIFNKTGQIAEKV
ncbi:PREDICTED: cytochrome P450 4C1-like [Nicrophorus vespilloides]|uniref:Cytochrome P450 4C1-like n=1 Tax=Nicrophorus vespilloides TaxID=110193 RepID=A0ABM1MK73_NICVS|nr:PREDICTED: cytochrome P450 4C1-like [Nicrophorus vespilloides]